MTRRSALQRFALWLQYLAIACCAAQLVATVATAAARLHWVFELACHFHLQHALAAVVPLGVLLSLRRRWLACVPFALLVYHLWILAPVLPAWQTTAPEEHGSRLLVANVLTSNPHKEKVRAMLRETDPSIVILLETNQAWSDALEDLDAVYPHSYKVPRMDNFGMLLFSRAPVRSLQKHLVGEARLPLLVAEIEHDGRDLTVIAAHPLPPVSSRAARERLTYLRAIAEHARRAKGPVIVAGDLNITSGSPYFHDLLAAGELRDSRRGFGPQPSWPGFIWPLRMCIDHVLVSEEVQVHNRQLGPATGSDHLPVIIDFTLAH